MKSGGNMKKTLFCLFCLSLLTIPVIAAAKKKTAAVKEITVQSWQYALGDYKGYSRDDELTKAIGDDFTAVHGGLKANVKILRQADHYESLRVDFAGGTAPDVIGIAPGATLDQFKDHLVPLRQYAEKEWGPDWEKKFTDAAFTTIKLSGDKIYAFPSAMSASGTIWYNTELLKKAGITSVPKTWDEMIAASSKLRTAHMIPLMFGGKDDWQNYDMFITIIGSINKELTDKLFANKSDWTHPDVVKAFTYYQNLYGKGIVQDGALSTTLYNEGYSQWRDDDGNSTLAMIFNGSWDLGSLKQSNSYYTKFSSYGIKAGTFPSIEGKKSAILTAPDVAWAVNADSKNKDAAWEFIKWMCYDMQQQVVNGLGFFSVLKNAPAPTVPLKDDYKAAYTAISSAVAGDMSIGFRASFYPQMNKALFENLQLLATNQISPAKAAVEMERACAEID
jgi:raffinose/stachyose/melibiose transport system substrate-binding protein